MSSFVFTSSAPAAMVPLCSSANPRNTSGIAWRNSRASGRNSSLTPLPYECSWPGAVASLCSLIASVWRAHDPAATRSARSADRRTLPASSRKGSVTNSHVRGTL